MTDSVKFTPTKSIDSAKALKAEYTKYNNSAARAEQFSQKYIDQVNIQNAKNNSANRGVSPLEFLEKSADIYGTIRKANVAAAEAKAKAAEEKEKKIKEELNKEVIRTGATLDTFLSYNTKRDKLFTDSVNSAKLLKEANISSTEAEFFKRLEGDRHVYTHEILLAQAAKSGKFGQYNEEITQHLLDNNIKGPSGYEYSVGHPEDREHWGKTRHLMMLEKLGLEGEINVEHYKKYIEPAQNKWLRENDIYAGVKQAKIIQGNQEKIRSAGAEAFFTDGKTPNQQAKMLGQWLQRHGSEFENGKHGLINTLSGLYESGKITRDQLALALSGQTEIKGLQGRLGQFESNILSKSEQMLLHNTLDKIDREKYENVEETQKVESEMELNAGVTQIKQQGGNENDLLALKQNFADSGYHPTVLAPIMDKIDNEIELMRELKATQQGVNQRRIIYQNLLENHQLSVERIQKESNHELRKEFLSAATNLDAAKRNPHYKTKKDDASVGLIRGNISWVNEAGTERRFTNSMSNVNLYLQAEFDRRYFHKMLAEDDDGNPLYKSSLLAAQETQDEIEKIWLDNGGDQKGDGRGLFHFDVGTMSFKNFKLRRQEDADYNNQAKREYKGHLDRIDSQNPGAQSYEDSIKSGAYLSEDLAKQYIERYMAGHKAPSWLRTAGEKYHNQRADKILIDSAIHYGLITEDQVDDRSSLADELTSTVPWLKRQIQCIGPGVPTKALAALCIANGAPPELVGY